MARDRVLYNLQQVLPQPNITTTITVTITITASFAALLTRKCCCTADHGPCNAALA